MDLISMEDIMIKDILLSIKVDTHLLVSTVPQ